MTSQQPRVAVVTGAGSGLGRACAGRLGADGLAVVVNDISATQDFTPFAAMSPPAAGSLTCQ
jgi:NAD(P)-dependent dehydrogenase (short-subunit alcohol dehydrogenase family)